MNNPLDDLNSILESAGLNPSDLSSSERRPSSERPSFSAVTDQREIQRVVSSPDTTYVAIQKDNPEPVTISSPQAIVVPTEEVLSDDDFDDILGNLGFHSTETVSDATPVSDTTYEHEAYYEGLERDNEGGEESLENNNINDGLFQDIVPGMNLADGDTGHIEDTADTTANNPNFIAPNPKSLLVDASTSRFSGAEWYEEIRKSNIIVAGVGGIGSNAVFQLARLCPASLLMYDDDTVELANMSGQLFSRSDMGLNKANAVSKMISSYTTMTSSYAIPRKFTPTDEAGDIMICGFDSMRARRMFFDSWRKHVAMKTREKRKKCLFLDGRLSIDTLQVFALTGDDEFNINRYDKEFLFQDYQAEETVCSLKQTTYLACMIGSVITNLFVNFIANSLNPVLPYDLPFFTEYDSQNMIFKTEK